VAARKVTQDGLSLFRDPSQAQSTNGRDPELPLDDTHNLAFRQIGDFRFVQVVSREPIPELSSPLEPSVRAPLPLPGLIARAMRAGYYAVKGLPHPFDRQTRYPARFFFPESQISNRVLSPFTAIALLKRTTMAARRAFHILTSLPVAAREALSLGKRIG
ncbi:unnamed protein product, partial [marine sediment metagenome]